MINEKYVADLEERVELLETRLSNYNFFLLTGVMVTPDTENDFNYFELIGNGEEKISFFIDNSTLDYIKSFGLFQMVGLIEKQLDLKIIIEHGQMHRLSTLMTNMVGKSDSLRAKGKFNGFKEIKIHGR